MTEATRRHPYSDTPNPKRFGTVSPLDPEFFLNCDEFVDEVLGGERSGKHSPAWVAAQLEDYAEQTLSALRKFKGRGAEFRRLQIDATIQGKLGKFFAAKLRSGVFYSFYLRTNDPEALRKAIAESRSGRATWAELANTAKNVYRDDVTYGPDYYQRGHWMDRLAAIDADIADLEKVLSDSPANTGNAINWKMLGDAMEHANKGAN